MGTKRLSLLLDACTIIHADKVKKWEVLYFTCDIAVPSIVAGKELAPYLDGETGEISPIDLEPLIESGKVKKVEAAEIELSAVICAIKEVLGLDDGELDALALMFSRGLPGYSFCTSDSAAIQAAAILELRYRMISLEEVLNLIGHARELPIQCTKKFLDQWLVKGSALKIRYGL